jgi:protease IV
LNGEIFVRKKKLYLDLLLKDEIVEGHPESSLFSRKAKTALQQVVEILQRAAKDPRIAALLLTIENLDSGWARLSEMRRSLSGFRQSGKPIYCFMQDGGNAEYYLASACTHIFMPPASHLRLVGLAVEAFFLREILDRFGIQAQLQSLGEYKSAAEMFTRTGMSAPAREQMDVLLDDSYDEFCRALQERGFSREQVAAYIDRGPYTAREALDQKLLDGVCYHDEMADKLKLELDKKIRAVPAAKYFKGEGFLKRLFTFRRKRIAIIHVLGQIDTGESHRNQSGRDVAGSDTIQAFLDHAEHSRRIRAIVLRVDSPGGSGIASDLIWRKISLVGKIKPVVISFGDVAASGGYYISAPGSHIFAEPTSITGSIGVLAGKIVVRELMQRLSVHRESMQRGAHAGYDSVFSEFSEEEAEQLRRQISEFYREDFIKKVAEGRKISEEAVDQAGRGRVWSGKRAKEHQLIDEFGGIFEAIQHARKLAGISESKKVRVIHYYRHRRFWERLMPDFHSPIMTRVLSHPALDALGVLEDLGKQGILLLMPYRIRIH